MRRDAPAALEHRRRDTRHSRIMRAAVTRELSQVVANSEACARAKVCRQLGLVLSSGCPCLESAGSPGEDSGADIEVDNAVSHTLELQLLVDHVFAMLDEQFLDC